MKVGNFDTRQRVFIIAEIGNNHEGDLALAEKLIYLAADAGADAVKFQAIIPEELVSVKNHERIAQLNRLCLKITAFERLSRIAEQRGVMFLATVFDVNTVAVLNPILPAFKIASGDNDFFPLLKVIAETGKPMLMSAGLSDLKGISKSKQFIDSIWAEKNIVQEMAVLHCVSSYPTAPEDANLLAIRELMNLGVTVGYSDHTIGIDAACLAVACGARIIEKHFTLDKNYSSFCDHKLSADPEDLSALVKKVREAECFLGSGGKDPRPCEVGALMRLRRSIVAKRDLAAGEILSEREISWVRPGDGLPPGNETRVIGKQLRQAISRGENILPEHLKEI